MTSRDIARHRMINQGILNSTFSDPQTLVRWMGCIQAPDLASAKWAIGNRVQGITEADVKHAFDEGEILRIHLLRPMWHIVSRQDIRWMLRLTAPRIRPVAAELHKRLRIDNHLLRKGKDALTDILAGGRHRTRKDLQTDLKKRKINTDDIRFGLLLMDAELDGIICSGRSQGRDLTYDLLDERVPVSPVMDHDASIAELGHRYFMSRGPATLHDFIAWSCLPPADAQKMLALNERQLTHAVVHGEAYFFSASMPREPEASRSLHMLSAFDEYTTAYKDRSATPKPMLVKDGELAGIWKRQESKTQVHVKIFPAPAQKLTAREVSQAAQNYARFLAKALI